MAEKGIQIQTDEPISSAKFFNFDVYAKALTRIIAGNETKTPLVVGIFGQWGSGKTSLMSTVQTTLEVNNTTAESNLKIKTIWFNAWEQSYAHADIPTGPSLLHCIYQELGGNDSKSEKIKMLGRGILGIIGEVGFRKFLGLTLGEVQNKFEITIKSRKDFSESFKSAIKDYLEKEKYSRIVIFIDDLDRCLPESAVEILESIKLFLNAENCIFILGVDREIIAECIRIRYKDFTLDSTGSKNPISGEDYLEKIIQLTFQLPPIGAEDLKDYINDLFKVPDEFYTPYLDILIKEIGHNPRKIKRFINIIEFQRNLGESVLGKIQAEIGEEQSKKQIKKRFDALIIEWAVISNRHPEFQKAVVSENIILSRIHEYIQWLSENLEHELSEKSKELPEEFIKLKPYLSNKQLLELIRVFQDEIKEIPTLNIIKQVIHLSSVTGTTKIEEKYAYKQYTKENIVKMLRENINEFNKFRSENPGIKINLSGENFSGADLTNANLSDIIFNEANLSDANLSGANLSGAYFVKANLSNVIFTGANFSGVNFSEAILSGVKLPTDLSGSILSEAKLSGKDLSGTNLSKAVLANTDFSKANLSETNLSEANLYRAILSGADLSGADLSGVNLNDANLSGAKLIGTIAGGVEVNARTKTERIILVNKEDSKYKAKTKQVLIDMPENLRKRILEANKDLNDIYNAPDQSSASPD